MHDSWTCLMVEKGPGVIADDVRTALKMTACQLALDKLDRMRISHEVCEGIMQTEWKTHVVGSRSGVLFRAQITEETGDYFVNFLLNEDDLKKGAEVIRQMREEGSLGWHETDERFPVEELYHFYDLRKHKLH